MNIHRIALFIFFLNASVVILAAAEIPIACSDSGNTCFEFDVTTITSTSISDIIIAAVEEDEYKSTQIEEEIATDIFTATAKAIEKTGSILAFAVFSVYYIVIFFFGSSDVALAIAVALQAATYYFFGRSLFALIKDAKGDI